MPESVVEKYLQCPTCQTRVSILFDRDLFRGETKSGVKKRIYQHLDHYLLLDIDGNGDIRSEVPIEIENTQKSLEESTDLLIWLELIKSKSDEPCRLFVIDEPSKYRKSMSSLIERIYAEQETFSFEMDEAIELQYANVSISVEQSLGDSIMDQDVVIIFYSSEINLNQIFDDSDEKTQIILVSDGPKEQSPEIINMDGIDTEPIFIDLHQSSRLSVLSSGLQLLADMGDDK